MKRLYLAFLIAASFCSCDLLYKVFTECEFFNESDLDITYTSPEETMHYLEFETADTTLYSYWPYVAWSTAFKHTSHYHKNRLDSFEDWIPKNSEFVSIFVIDDALFREMTVEEVFKNGVYLQRYDLTLKDLHSLCDSSGKLILCYPPDERMKNVHMWPPYGQSEPPDQP